ncbi:MAG: PIN domain-containing protein [Phycisphaeraceae bacterium]
MILYVLRGVFILLVAAVAALYLISNQRVTNVSFAQFVLMMSVALGLGLGVVAIDAGTRRKKLSSVSGVFLGLIAGMLAAWALSFVVDLAGLLTTPELSFQVPRSAAEQAALSSSQLAELERLEAYHNILEGIKVVIGLITCYVSISLVLQTKDDFRFVIPYVEFTKEIRGARPILLDTSVIIDGRILDIVKTHFLQGALIVPKFVLNELQTVADSPDKLKRARGRRGLDILNKLQEDPHAAVAIQDNDAEGANVDQKLLSLALTLQARVMTNDFNLAKIATLRHVEVLNLNDLAGALKPVVLPGESMTVRLLKAGEGATQGVGYLEDGTMVVVENGRSFIGQEVDMTVTSTLQTSAGRMIFGRVSNGQASTSESHGSAPGSAGASGGPRATGHRLEGSQDHAAAGEATGGSSSPEVPHPPQAARQAPPTGRNPRRGA